MQYLGCQWQIPSDFERRTDGSYFHPRTSANIVFTEMPEADGQDLLDYVGTFEYDQLKVEEFTSNANSAISGISVYKFTRENHTGEVTLLNSDFNESLVRCAKR